jgi:hypothetical protein
MKNESGKRKRENADRAVNTSKFNGMELDAASAARTKPRDAPHDCAARAHAAQE